MEIQALPLMKGKSLEPKRSDRAMACAHGVRSSGAFRQFPEK